MLKSLFPRLFGQFREGGIIHAKFKVTTGGATPVFALKSAVGTQNYQGLSLVGSATGLLTLSLAGGARAVAMLGAEYINIQNPTVVANYLELFHDAAIVESGVTVTFHMARQDTGAFANSVANDEIHFTLYVDR